MTMYNPTKHHQQWTAQTYLDARAITGAQSGGDEALALPES